MEIDFNTDRHLKGIGGWLILVAFGIIISPLVIIIQVFPLYRGLIADGTLKALMTPGSQVFNPLLFSITVTEMLANGALVAAWIFLAVLFFSKKQLFPKLYIGVMLFTLIFLILDALVIKAAFPDLEVFDPETVNGIVRGIIAASIWIPYMLKSKRVKLTFVN